MGLAVLEIKLLFPDSVVDDDAISFLFFLFCCFLSERVQLQESIPDEAILNGDATYGLL